MTLSTSPSATYSTLDLFKAYTPVSSQRSINQTVWEPFAIRAERIVDAYVNISEEVKYSKTQTLKFPIKDENGNSYIPDDIVLAVIEITSDLILKGDPVAADGMIATSENWDASGYSVTKQKKSSSSSDDVKIEMPPLARQLLMPWSNKVASLNY